jgi:hypothetical protein
MVKGCWLWEMTVGMRGINRGFVDEWRLLVLAEKQEGGAEKRNL